jgi:SAM-dependent methyltransferase
MVSAGEKSSSGSRPANLLFIAAILLSAFLLFQVQPLIAKLILPWFGGSAAVWTVCLLFFQTGLLAGYSYAHWVSRLRPGLQAALHITLLVCSMAVLPILPAERWKPTGGADPLGGILLLLFRTAGFPYMLLAATSPLVQSVYARRESGAMPWRYFAFSNAGSMAGLLCYPTLTEPLLTGRQQALAWSWGYVVFALLCSSLMLTSLRHSKAAPEGITPPDESRGKAPGFERMCLWALLSAFPSALLLAVTNHLTQNVAAVPFLWVLPLSVYLLSLILCFDSARWYRRGLYARLAALTLAGLAVSAFSGDFTSVKFAVAAYTVAVFVLFMVCHGELYRYRPGTGRLTGYYLTVAFGGAVGGALIAVLAPFTFNALYDLPLVLALMSCFFAWLLWSEPGGSGNGPDAPAAGLFANRLRRRPRQLQGYALCGLLLGAVAFVAFRALLPAWRVWDKPTIGGFAVTICLLGLSRFRLTDGNKRLTSALALLPAVAIAGMFGIGLYNSSPTRLLERNFYGALMVDDIVADGGVAEPVRFLLHGTVNHGVQFLTSARRREPTTYYGRGSGIGRTMAALGRRGPIHAGLIGLGAGTLAAYGRRYDRYRFYEINPLVVGIAETRFSFLRDSGAAYDVVQGDARLSLEAEQPQDFDLLALDAFSGDAVPVHLLTREAFRLYWRHLKPGGVIAVHLTNRYLNLAPVVLLAGFESAKEVRVVRTRGDEAALTWASEWALITAQSSLFDEPELAGFAEFVKPVPGLQAWTDDSSSLYRILR